MAGGVEELQIDLTRGGPGVLRLTEDTVVIELPRILREPVPIARSNIETIVWLSKPGFGFRAQLRSNPATTVRDEGLLLRPSRWRDDTLRFFLHEPVRFVARRSFKLTHFAGRRRPLMRVGRGVLRVGWRMEPKWLTLRTTGEPRDAKRAFERWGIEFPEFGSPIS